jgi:hypothetical protein
MAPLRTNPVVICRSADSALRLPLVAIADPERSLPSKVSPFIPTSRKTAAVVEGDDLSARRTLIGLIVRYCDCAAMAPTEAAATL